MELKLEYYVGLLIISSLGFFFIVGELLKTAEPYRDLLLTVAVVHFIMSKLIVIKSKGKNVV